jgi:hypothetical protein
MSTTVNTTELEAINVLLAVADEAPVQSLTVPGLQPLSHARTVLNEASRLVQSAGWKFNTEYEYPLPRQIDNTIALPPNAVKIDVDDSCLGTEDPVARGIRLYDAKNHTYTFTRDLTATVVFLLPWEELPQPARHYIMIKAARTFQGRQAGAGSVDGYTANDEEHALLAFSQHEADVGDHNTLRDNWSTAQILMGYQGI